MSFGSGFDDILILLAASDMRRVADSRTLNDVQLNVRKRIPVKNKRGRKIRKQQSDILIPVSDESVINELTYLGSVIT